MRCPFHGILISIFTPFRLLSSNTPDHSPSHRLYCWLGSSRFFLPPTIFQRGRKCLPAGFLETVHAKRSCVSSIDVDRCRESSDTTPLAIELGPSTKLSTFFILPIKWEKRGQTLTAKFINCRNGYKRLTHFWKYLFFFLIYLDSETLNEIVHDVRACRTGGSPLFTPSTPTLLYPLRTSCASPAIICNFCDQN